MSKVKRGQARFDRWGGVYLTLRRIVFSENKVWVCLVLHSQSDEHFTIGAGDMPGDTPEINESWLEEWAAEAPWAVGP